MFCYYHHHFWFVAYRLYIHVPSAYPPPCLALLLFLSERSKIYCPAGDIEINNKFTVFYSTSDHYLVVFFVGVGKVYKNIQWCGQIKDYGLRIKGFRN